MKKNVLFMLSAALAFGVFVFSNSLSVAKQSTLTDIVVSDIHKAPVSIYNDGIPNTHEVQAIMQTIENAYDIEAESAYTLDLRKFSTVFINDPRFNVDPSTLEVVRELSNQPKLKSAGWLDYKMAYSSWRRDAILHSEAIRNKVKTQNRELTNEEKASLIDVYGRSAPARVQGSIRNLALIFKSVNIKDDVSTVVIKYGARTAELTLVLVDKKWYIAGYRRISLNP